MLASAQIVCDEALDRLIEEINVALSAANWSTVVALTPALFEQASATGYDELAAVVADLYWIASDALHQPLAEGGRL